MHCLNSCFEVLAHVISILTFIGQKETESQKLNDSHKVPHPMIKPGFKLPAGDKQQFHCKHQKQKEERSLLPLKRGHGMNENRVKESKVLKMMNREGPRSAPAESP